MRTTRLPSLLGSRYGPLLVIQSAANLLLAVWLYLEYTHNPFMQAYVSNVWASVWPEITIGISAVIVAVVILAFYGRRHSQSLPAALGSKSKLEDLEEPDNLARVEVYQSKISKGLVEESEVDRNLWEDVYNDSFGNEKITFARENGFYHCRRSDLENMDSAALMNIFETSKKFLDFDMYRRYLDTKPPVGYDPMAMQRQIKRAVELIQEILRQRYEKEADH